MNTSSTTVIKKKTQYLSLSLCSTQVRSRPSEGASWSWGEVAARPLHWAGREGAGAWPLPRIPNGPTPAASAGAAVAAAHGRTQTHTHTRCIYTDKYTQSNMCALVMSADTHWQSSCGSCSVNTAALSVFQSSSSCLRGCEVSSVFFCFLSFFIITNNEKSLSFC